MSGEACNVRAECIAHAQQQAVKAHQHGTQKTRHRHIENARCVRTLDEGLEGEVFVASVILLVHIVHAGNLNQPAHVICDTKAVRLRRT